MTRSRFTAGPRRPNADGRPCDYRTHVLRRLPLASAISAILAGGVPAAHAATETESAQLEEVVVTAQKRTENLQSVPISIEVLSGAKLEQLDVSGLDGYVKYSPSIAYSRGQGQGGNGQPGTSHIYMRGVVSGASENHSGSQPSVGTYLDEQPVTTIDGTPDIHLYDIQRIEVLEGPQGTLYGASSEAGTVRILTNKPDPTGFSASFDGQLNQVAHGHSGTKVDAYVNIPLSSTVAVRLVGYYEKDGGYISNVRGTNSNACIQNGVLTYPTWDGVPSSYPAVTPCPAPGVIGAGAVTNAAYAQNNYNTAYSRGGRAALKWDVNDNWSVTPTVMIQDLSANGFFGYDPGVGDLKVAHFGPEVSDDNLIQTALTIEGKISDFDLTYAGAFMKRQTHSIADYSDYSEFYDRIFGSGAYWLGNNGKPIMPQELVVTKGYFQKWSQELRLSTPQQLPVHATVGVFVERQQHRIWEQYVMPGYGFTNPYGAPNSPTPNPNGLADSLSIPTLANTIWLTDETRVDRDQAAFAQATWDITSKWSLNGGLRYYTYDNTLQGFYGYSAGYGVLAPGTVGLTGVPGCFAPPTTIDAPCTDLNRRVTSSGSVPRGNVTYKIDPDKLVYATYSKGFRPGGVNRTQQAGIGPYQADYLKNYEVGWKTQWFDRRVRWNGAVFWEDWKNFQFSFLGPNSLTIIENGGNARIKGVENEIEWQATSALALSTSFTFLDARLTENYCGVVGVTNCPNLVTKTSFATVVGPQAPAGTNLPITPKFKGNVIARYSFDEVAGWKPFAQTSWVYQTQSTPTLKVYQAQIVGKQPAYGLVDFTAGAQLNKSTFQLIVTNVADRRAQLSRFVQTNPNHDNQPYVIPAQPRTIAIQFGQKF